jgi:hypothetical protein
MSEDSCPAFEVLGKRREIGERILDPTRPEPPRSRAPSARHLLAGRGGE